MDHEYSNGKADSAMLRDVEARLDAAQRQISDLSLVSGMAEVATSVLHNVGNVLNSVNISANILRESLRKSRVTHLARASALLDQHTADLAAFITQDPRGKQLPAYFAELARTLIAERDRMIEEMEQLYKNVEHVKEIVSMQQSYARLSGTVERVRVEDLVEDALRMNAGALIRHDVDLIREYETDLPEILVDKHKVLQILVNLIRNAKYACDESARTDKQMTMRVRRSGDRVLLSVIDNGVGIPPENLPRLFTHGFTTRKNGHGFGLHSGLQAAQELGGALTVHSDGFGKGACFTLELPVKQLKS